MKFAGMRFGDKKVVFSKNMKGWGGGIWGMENRRDHIFILERTVLRNNAPLHPHWSGV